MTTVQRRPWRAGKPAAIFKVVVTERDRARMRLIAQAMGECNREAAEAAVHRTPGQNIEEGFRLGNAALAISQHRSPRPEAISPILRWRALTRRQ